MGMDAMTFDRPSRVVIEPDGRRIWSYVMRFEPGRVWIVPGEAAHLGFGDPVRLSFEGDGPRIAMSGVVTWSGTDAIAVDVAHELDRHLTRAWTNRASAALPSAHPLAA